MRPNLKRLHVTALSFQAEVILTEEQISQIRSIAPPDEDGDSVSFEKYPEHVGWMWVIEPVEVAAKEQKRFLLLFNFNKETGKIPKHSPHISQIMGILSSTHTSVNFDCQVLFQFRKHSRPKPIICLPMKCTALSNLPFDTIEGIHLSKLGDGHEKERHDVILENLANGGISEAVMFSHTFPVDESVADQILAEAVKISEAFVQRE